MKVQAIIDAVGLKWLQKNACVNGLSWAFNHADDSASEIPSADAAWVLFKAPADRLTPEQVAALVSRVTRSEDAARVLIHAPADRLTPEQVAALVARVTDSADAAWVLRKAPSDRLTPEQRAGLEAVAKSKQVVNT